MMKKNLFLLVLPVLSCCWISPAVLSGETQTKTIEVSSDYYSLVVDGAILVRYVEGASEVTLKADATIMPYVVVKQENEVLRAYVKKSVRYKGGLGRVELIIPLENQINNISLSGASALESVESIELESLSIKLNGASKFSAEVEAQKVDVTASGASFCELTGDVRDLSVGLSGASVLSSSTSRAEAENVKCDISGASVVYVNCGSQISGSASGASVIRYGNRKVINSVSCTGASSATGK